jgi:hypothetical protein
MNKFKIKDTISTIVAITVILLLLILFGKLVVYDCIIGTKIYDDNDIVIRYHRYINIFTAKNNSDETIYMHYQHGRCRRDANLDKYKYDIKYYKKSEDFEIKSGDKYVKFMGIRDDAYLFTIVNEDDLYDTVSYNKHDWFKKY